MLVSKFQAFGEAVDRRWREVHYDERAFPDLATSALTEFVGQNELTLESIFDAVRDGDLFQLQHDPQGRFGQPPLTMFQTRLFTIDFLVWMDGTTSIHQHGFSGAFAVAHGSSLHARYDFEQAELLNPAFKLGAIRFRNVELLRKGDVRSIPNGSDFIHALFHLDQPSVSLVLRTFRSLVFEPQLDYLVPFVAASGETNELHPSLMRQLQLLSSLHRMEPDRALRFARDLLQRKDFPGVYRVLEEAHRHLSRERFTELLDVAQKHHGARIDAIKPVFSAMRWREQIIARRRLIRDPEARYFLALLLNVPRREELLELVRARKGDQAPEDTVVGWLRQFARSDDPKIREAGFEFDDDALEMLRRIMSGASVSDAAAWLESEGYEREDVLGTIAQLKESMLRPLFSE